MSFPHMVCDAEGEEIPSNELDCPLNCVAGVLVGKSGQVGDTAECPYHDGALDADKKPRRIRRKPAFKIGDRVRILLPAWKGKIGIITEHKPNEDYEWEVSIPDHKWPVPCWGQEMELVKRYLVPINYSGLSHYVVDAASLDEAEETAKELFKEGDEGTSCGNEFETIDSVGTIEEVKP